jgi:hypothetical protein
VRVLGAAALEVMSTNAPLAKKFPPTSDLTATPCTHRPAGLQRGQPRVRTQHRRERELVLPQTIGMHRVEQLHCSRFLALACASRDHGVPRDDTPLGHSVEHLLRDAELPDLSVEDKQLSGDVFVA